MKTHDLKPNSRIRPLTVGPLAALLGLPIRQLRKVEDYVTADLAEEISIECLTELVELSSSHFALVFKESTGMTPLQFVTRQRITRAQQLIRETSRSLNCRQWQTHRTGTPKESPSECGPSALSEGSLKSCVFLAANS